MNRMTPLTGVAVLWIALGGSPGPAQAQLAFRGLTELTAANRDEGFFTNGYNHSDSNFDPYRLHLFVESEVADRFRVFAQISFAEMSGVMADGAYLMWSPLPGRDLHLEVGKIPWPVGTWGPRTYSDKNPLIGLPLMYQYHTSLRVDAVPPSPDALLALAGTGQSGWKGMPVVYDRCWDFGVVVTGSARPWEFAVGATNGTTGAATAGPDWNDGKSILGRIGLAPWPVLRLGVSGAFGPYLPEWLESSLPAGSDVGDFDQKLAMADLEVLYAHLELRAEGYLNAWETPTVGELAVRGVYLEGKATVAPGFYLAARAEAMRFSELAGRTNPSRPWDNDMDRFEAGAGYRVARQVLLKAVYQRNVAHQPAGPASNLDVGAVQLSIGF